MFADARVIVIGLCLSACGGKSVGRRVDDGAGLGGSAGAISGGSGGTSGMDSTGGLPEDAGTGGNGGSGTGVVEPCPSGDVFDPVTLWEVDETGDGRSIGEYPPAPTDVTLQSPARLDASGALFQHGDTLAPQGRRHE